MKKIISSVIIMLFFISFASALLDETQVNSNPTNGIEIDYPKINTIQNNQPFNLTIFNYNETNGKILLGSSCSLGIFNHTGNMVYNVANLSSFGNGYNHFISSGNFTINNIYSLNIYCSNGDLGGFASGLFEVNNTGNTFNVAQAILYSLVGVVVLFLFMLSLYGGLTIQFKNQRNQNQEVVSINWQKYLKIFCLGMSYYLLIGIVFITWNLVYAYAQWQNLALVFNYMYRLLMALALPVFIGIWIMVIINYINDKKIEAFVKRMGIGYSG